MGGAATGRRGGAALRSSSRASMGGRGAEYTVEYDGIESGVSAVGCRCNCTRRVGVNDGGPGAS